MVDELTMDLDLEGGMEGLDEMNLDEADLSQFGEIDTDIAEPHIRINTKELQNVLKNAKLLSMASGRDVVSKSVSLHVENNVVVARATDFDAYLEYHMALLNDTNVLEEPICIPIDILSKLVKACPAITAIIKDEEGMKMRLAGGDILLETLSVSLDKFTPTDKGDSPHPIEAPDLLSVIRSMAPIVVAAVSPTERRIVFKDGVAMASYMWAVVKAPGDYPDMELKLKDLQILKQILTNRDGTIYVAKTNADAKVPRTFIYSDDFSYATLSSVAVDSVPAAENMNDTLSAPSTHIDLLQLYKMVEVSADLPYSVGKIGLNNAADGISLAIKTKKGKDSIFSLSGSFDGAPKPLDKEVILQSKLLRILLRSFGSTASVRVSVTPTGVGIQNDSLQAVCYVES